MKNFRRRFGFIDTLLTLMHDYHNGSTDVAALTTFQGKLEVCNVTKTLTALQKRHPNLRAKIIQDKTKPYYEFEFSEKSGDFEFRKINRIDHDHTISIMENEINKPIIYQKFLWRTVLLYGGNSEQAVHDLIFIAHHSILDGCSAARLAHDFMTILSALTLNSTFDFPPLPALEAIETYYSEGFTWEMFEERDQKIRNSPLVNPTPWKFHKKAELKNRKTKIVNKVLSSNFVNKLRIKTRQEQTTVNSALNAAIASVFIEEQDDFYVELDMPSPVDLSRRTNPPISRENIGNMVAWPSVPLKFDKDTGFWDISRQYSHNLAAGIELFAKNPRNCDIDYMKENLIKPFFQTEYPLIFSYITNIGVVDLLKKYEPFSLIAFSFLPALHNGGTAAPLTCTTVNGKMHLNFFYPEPLVDRKWHADFVSKVIKTLKENI
jgi:NRPS condensation-like uncharacterized protein